MESKKKDFKGVNLAKLQCTIQNHKHNKQQVKVSNRKCYKGHKLNVKQQQQTQTSNE